MSDKTTPPVRAIDRSSWGSGPWDGEPDHIDFVTAAGLPAIVHRNMMGVLCGYVAVAPEHPLHGEADGMIDLSVHGGLSYSGLCAGAICHVPAPGEPDNVWWLGFDCGHCDDIAPSMQAMHESLGHSSFGEVYRNVAYVRSECESLAAQIAAMSDKPKEGERHEAD